jgi:hypothetical protein
MKNEAAFELYQKVFDFLHGQGIQQPEEAIETLSRYWLSDSVILANEEFAEELAYLRYYSRLTGKAITEIVQEALKDWLEVSYTACVPEMERKRGLPETTIAVTELL